jgi:hypothetical protein
VGVGGGWWGEGDKLSGARKSGAVTDAHYITTSFGNTPHNCRPPLLITSLLTLRSLPPCRNKIFVNHLVHRLQADNTMSALARMCLLKLLGQIVNKNTYTEHGIFPMLAKFANDETQILISTISKNLMKRVSTVYSPVKKMRG